MGSKYFGRCALCGNETELTYEHIPPRKAFNWFPAKTVTGAAYINSIAPERKPWDFSGLPYNNTQRGTGAISICRQCNNDTGTWYGDEYIRFVHGFHYLMQKEQPKAGMTMYVEEATFRPLSVLKQIVSMFCSLNKEATEDPRFKLLREFVLDKTSTAFPKKRFRIGMYLFSSGIQRMAPISVRLLTGDNEPRIEVLSEIATYPVGFILYFDPDDMVEMPCPDISGFCDCRYDEECRVQIALPVYECNIMFPGDFRSKVEIERCIDENTKWQEENEQANK